MGSKGHLAEPCGVTGSSVPVPELGAAIHGDLGVTPCAKPHPTSQQTSSHHPETQFPPDSSLSSGHFPFPGTFSRLLCRLPASPGIHYLALELWISMQFWRKHRILWNSMHF